MAHVSAERVVEVAVEIPQNSQNKYEFDKERGVFCLDRVLHSPVHYPADYGYLADTLAEDGDPLDALVLISAPTFPGCHVRARVLGCLEMEDDKGRDVKVLAVAEADPRLAGLRRLQDVSPHLLREIEHFFSIYKELENKRVTVQGWGDAAEALRVIDAAAARAKPAV